MEKKMKNIIVLLLLICSVGLFANDGMGDIPRNNVKFSNKIFRETVKINDGKNFALSPLSLNMSMSLLSNGAKGETLNEFASVLQNGPYDQKLMNTVNRILLANSKGLKVDKYNIANGIWVRGDFERQFYLIAKNYYNGDVFVLNNNSKKDINNWVKKKTNGKIDQIVDQISPNDKAVIVNSIYFYSGWTNPFPVNNTESGSFILENGDYFPCAMMKDKGLYKVFEYNGGKVLIKELKGYAAMYFILPPRGTKLADFVKDIDFYTLITNNTEGDEFYKVTVPKFKIEYSEKMNNIFKNLGMKDAFDLQKANFLGLSKEKTYISSILHKATIGIDEKGCEASAATSVKATAKGIDREEKEISFNRPFAFAIVDQLDDIVIFEGCVYKPE